MWCLRGAIAFLSLALAESSSFSPPSSVLTRLATNAFHAVDACEFADPRLCCNIQQTSKWPSAAGGYFQTMFNGTIDGKCATRLDGYSAIASQDLSRSLIHSASYAIRTAAEDFRRKGEQYVLANEWNADWNSGVFPLSSWSSEGGSQSCTLQAITALRVDSKLYVRAAITNHPLDMFTRGGKRAILEEYISFQHSLRRRDGNTLELRMSSGTVTPSITRQTTQKNVAVLAARDAKQEAVAQAKDALQLGNMIILGLPLFLTLIPSALVGEMSSKGELLYVIATDILTVLPVLIKGIELIQVGTPHEEVVAFHIGDETTGLLEIWAAECAGVRFKLSGRVFVAVAVVLMLFGTTLELLFRKKDKPVIVPSRTDRSDHENTVGRWTLAALLLTAVSLGGAMSYWSRDRRDSWRSEQNGGWEWVSRHVGRIWPVEGNQYEQLPASFDSA